MRYRNLNFSYGDIFLGTRDGRIDHRDIDGNQIQVLYTDTYSVGYPVLGLTVDGFGNLYALVGGSVYDGVNPYIEKFGRDGISDGQFGDAPFVIIGDFPWDIVSAPNGNFFVAVVHNENELHIWKLNSSGTRIGNFTVASNIDFNTENWTSFTKQVKIDVTCDSRYVYYTDSTDTIFKYDTILGVQSANFSVLDADSPYIYRAFKILKTNFIVTGMTKVGKHGPSRSMCVNADEATIWCDETSPGEPHRAYKRSLTDGSAITSFETIVDDQTYCMASWYQRCANPGVARYNNSAVRQWFSVTTP